ncbi:MAG: alpha-xylosidase [Clostridia bacterium]|nr:alpha-xylosidase [Clostridia bacterium]
MLEKHLIAQTFPLAKKENIVRWKNYRVTVLQDRLFRVEQSENKCFRDEATQSVWFRNMENQAFTVEIRGDELLIKTERCSLILREERTECEIEFTDGKRVKADNRENLLGTYRTLDLCNGGRFYENWEDNAKEHPYTPVDLCMGVCAKNGVAVLDDSLSLTLGADGEIKPERADGTDEYVFAYGNDYRDAVKALYLITGKTPIVPRFALGNWWSRYHAYTQDEYMTLVQRFEDREIPLTVATVDMDWHWTTRTLEEAKQITALGRNTPYYGGKSGWTGYSWDTNLFPDHKAFLHDLQKKNLKITLNLHPADGVRWWEDQYEDMANAMGRDAASLEKIPFDMTNTDFINAYFSVLHKPMEKEGVNFWWMDWQQGTTSAMDGLDPLWMLNHYHYLDNAKENATPLLLSRYSGIGSHRYPLGFSGDTFVSFDTLAYLPYFTATASNVGYTWWSHDIGGHLRGEKNDELYVRFVQLGVFSPINRLHCSDEQTATKEPWFYQNGAGKIAEEFLRLRHQLIPYLYTASVKTHEEGRALIEPLYYEWKQPKAYEYGQEYLFGDQLLVVPVTVKRSENGYARSKAWLPEGVWTDIFTNDQYTVKKGGEERELWRTLDSIPVLIRAGGILPLSADRGNSVRNPQRLDILVWNGTGEFALREDGREEGNTAEYRTQFINEYAEENGCATQTLKIFGSGNTSVLPKGRKLRVLFKDVSPTVKVSVTKNGVEISTEKLYQDHASAEFVFEPNAKYVVKVNFPLCNALERLKARAKMILTKAEDVALKREFFLKKLRTAQSGEEYAAFVKESDFSEDIKGRLIETL